MQAFAILEISSQMLFSLHHASNDFREETHYKEATHREQGSRPGHANRLRPCLTQDQSLELQIAALQKVGCKKIFEDKASGSRAERPGLAKAQESFRKGDTLVVWKLDRLGRSVKNLVDLVGELQAGRPVQESDRLY